MSVTDFLQTVEKLAILALVTFLVYEAFKYGGSDLGKAIAKAMGGVAGFIAWLASQKGLVIGLIIAAIATPLLTALAGGGFALWKARIKYASKARSNEEKGKEKVKRQADEEIRRKYKKKKGERLTEEQQEEAKKLATESTEMVVRREDANVLKELINNNEDSGYVGEWTEMRELNNAPYKNMVDGIAEGNEDDEREENVGEEASRGYFDHPLE